MRIVLSLCLAFVMGLCHAQSIEGMTQRSFGKNRVQYKKFNWKMKSSPNFEIYFYDYGSRIATYAIKYAEEEYERVLNDLGHNPSQKTKLFIYNSIADLQQSNIGLNDENKGLGGQTSFIRPKIEIPFTGSLYDFKKEVTSGMAHIYVLEMMYGGSIREIVRNSLTLNLPDWYSQGVAAYVSEGWTEEMDDYMRAMIGSRKIRRPDKVIGDEAKIVGSSIWNFIAQKYGKQQISNILNMTRILRSHETSITNTLQVDFKTFLKEWRSFYQEMADNSKEGYKAIPYQVNFKKWNKKLKQFKDLKISPDGKYIAYSYNHKGRYTVLIRNLTKENLKKKTIFKTGFFKNTQRINGNMPLLAWSDQHELAILYQRKGITNIRLHDLNRRGKKTYQHAFKFFNQPTGFDISADANTFAISSDRTGGPSVIVGQNDLVLYDRNLQQLKKVTFKDLYDDTHPVFVGDSDERLIFSSNRPNDTLRAAKNSFATFQTLGGSYNLFLYDPKVSTENLTQLTYNTDKKSQPSMLDDHTLLYLSDQNGIQNLFKMDLNTKVSTPITNSIQDIRSYAAYLGEGEEGLLAFRAFFRKKRRENIVLNKHFAFSPTVLGPDTERIKILKARGIKPTTHPKPNIKTPEDIDTRPYNPDVIDTDEYQFDPKIIKEMQTSVHKAQKITEDVSEKKKAAVEVKGEYPYEAMFTAESSITTPLVDPLRGFGLLFEVDLGEMLENHAMNAGALMIADLKSTCYFLEYQYLKNRFDYTIRYDRKNLFQNKRDYVHKYHMNILTGNIAYPLSNAMRVSATAGYMDTKYHDIVKLSNPDVHNSYLQTGLEIVFDNTTVTGLNMRSGTRMKASFQNNKSLINASKDFNKFFVDIRNYQPVDRDLILATRLSFGKFGGKAPKKYALGGMDNWVNSKMGESGVNDPLVSERNVDNSDILFTDFATNLRGFDYNKFAGHKFFVINAELRIPIVKYIFQNNVSSNFFKNLQFTAFGDMGSTWDKQAPWKKENDFNTYLIEAKPFEVEVNNFSNPYLIGYGLGVRTLAFGYYVKLDFAWGMEDYIVADKAKTYLTIGYDF